jgi:hypothetical protein
MDKNITINMTMKNRADYLDMKLHNLQFQHYNLKDVEICITDAGSDDNIFDIIHKWKDKFYQIKWALSDRKKLPFDIPTNNPASDRNAQICNVSTFEKCIITDPEVFFLHNNDLQNISNMLNNKNTAIYYQNKVMKNGFKFPYNNEILKHEDIASYLYAENNHPNGLCMCFNKSLFIDMGGFDEEFSKGFAQEDTSLFNQMKELGVNMFSMPNSWVTHMWHGRPTKTKDLEFINNQRADFLVKNKLKSNITNINWKRPEMISNIKIFKGE